MKSEAMRWAAYQRWLQERAQDSGLRFHVDDRLAEFPGWAVMLENFYGRVEQALRRRSLGGNGRLQFALYIKVTGYALRWRWDGPDIATIAEGGFLSGWLDRSGARLLSYLGHRCVVCGEPAATSLERDPVCEEHVGLTASDLNNAVMQNLVNPAAPLETRIVLTVRSWANRRCTALQGISRASLPQEPLSVADHSPYLAKPRWLSPLLAKRVLRVLRRRRIGFIW